MARHPSFDLDVALEERTIPVPECGCLIWLGACNSEGYGHTMIKRKTKKIHRLVWERAHGPIPDGFEVMHSCDIPACVRIDHLALGTHSENIADMHRKGRGPQICGELHWQRRSPGRYAGSANPNYKHGRLCRTT